MKPPEDEVRRLTGEWLEKAELDFRAAFRLSSESEFRDIVVFHCQQAAEKFLKALLTLRQTEFPKTHVIRRLLILLEPTDRELAAELAEAVWLSPFGADIRYPGERAETLPGDQERALALAGQVRARILEQVRK